MGRKEEIMKSIRKSPKTASEISQDLNINTQDVRTYLQRLKTDGLIKEIDKDGREFVYDTTEEKKESGDIKKYKESVNFLNTFFKENIDYLLKNKKISNFIINNEDMFKNIEELLAK